MKTDGTITLASALEDKGLPPISKKESPDEASHYTEATELAPNNLYTNSHALNTQ